VKSGRWFLRQLQYRRAICFDQGTAVAEFRENNWPKGQGGRKNKQGRDEQM
jgi:hypothetical protein